MKTILNILKKAGGWRPSLYIRIENPPYLPLVIEGMPEAGPLGLPALSVTHYGEQTAMPCAILKCVSSSASTEVRI